MTSQPKLNVGCPPANLSIYKGAFLLGIAVAVALHIVWEVLSEAYKGVMLTSRKALMSWQCAMDCATGNSNDGDSIIDRLLERATDCMHACKVWAIKIMRDRLPYCMRCVKS